MNMLITNKDYKIHGLDLHFLFFKTNKFTQSLQLYNKVTLNLVNTQNVIIQYGKHKF